MSTSSSAPNPAAPVAHDPQHEDGISPDKGSSGVFSFGQLVIAFVEDDDGRRSLLPAVPNDRNGLVLPPEFDDVDSKVDGILGSLKERKPALHADLKDKSGAVKREKASK